MNYAQLKAEVAEWMHRGDVAERVPGFIELAEARFNRELRTHEQETRAQAIAAREWIGLPSDLLQMRAIKVDGRDVDYYSPQRIDRMQAEFFVPVPGAYTIADRQVRFYPAPKDKPFTVELLYYARIPSLSDAQPTNWLLESHPDVYLFGALIEGRAYVMDPERANLWEQRLRAALETLRRAEWVSKAGASLGRARAPSVR